MLIEPFPLQARLNIIKNRSDILKTTDLRVWGGGVSKFNKEIHSVKYHIRIIKVFILKQKHKKGN